MIKHITLRSKHARVKQHVLFLLSALLLGSASYAQYGSWTPVTTAAPHYNAGVMLLLTDGSVICKTSSGGSQGTRWDRLKPDIHGSYINGTWTTIAAMADDRLYFSSQVLPDGRVYVAGGEYGAGGVKAEVYNPLTNVWTPAPQIVYVNAISDANSALLPNGKVLQALVDTGNTRLNYIWDPATNTYTQTASCLRRNNEATWVRLPDNSVLFLDNYSTTSERYIPATNTWITDAVAPVNLYDAFGSEAGGGFLLPDGRVWFIGSTPTSAYYTPSGSTALGSWSAGPAIPFSQGAPDAASAMMANGKILLAVSPTPDAISTFHDTTVFYEFDYLTNTYTQRPAPGVVGDTVAHAAYITNMLDLPDGTVLYANQGSNRYYEYVPSGAPLAAGKPTVDSIIRISCDTFKATGKLFNGITEGASYGDDWQMNTNYPIIRLTSGTNVYYATTYKWNRIGAVMTGSLLDTTTFVLPAGLPAGNYTLELVVNGNPSAGRPFNNTFAISPIAMTICQGSNTTLTDVWPGGVWSTATTTIATIDAVTGVVTGVGAGSTAVVYTKGSCSTTSSVTVTGSPVLTPAGPVAICQGNTTALSSTTTGGAWSSSAGSIAPVNGTGTVTGTAAGTAAISYTAGGCSAVKTVTVNALPVATISPLGTITTCTVSSVALNANTGTGLSYQWKQNSSVIPGATNATYSANIGGYYTVVVTQNNCPVTSQQDTIINSSSTVAPITGASTVCVGQTSSLTDATATGTWSSDNMSLATVDASGTVYGAGAGSVNISYTISSSCGTATAVRPINVASPITVAPITGSSSACAGTTTTLSNATAAGNWSSSNGSVATVNNAGTVSAVSAGNAVISYVVTSSVGCTSSATATATVAVNAPPAAAVSPTGPITICSSGNIVLHAITGAGLTYQWYNGPSVIAAATTANYTATGPGSYTSMIANSGTGCSAISAAVAVDTIHAFVPGVTLTASNGTTICAGNTLATFTAATVNGGSSPTYQWYVNGVAAAGGNPYSYATANGDVVKCVMTSNASCIAPDTAVASLIMTVVPNVTPMVSVILSTGDTVCSGDTTTATAIPVNGGTTPAYVWVKNGANVSTNASYTFVPNNGDQLKVSVVSNYQCLLTPAATSDVYTMQVNQPVVNDLTVHASSSNTVAGRADTFTAIAPHAGAGAIYQWFVNGIPVQGANTAMYITSTLHNGDVVKCAVTSSNMCATPPTVTSGGIIVTVIPAGVGTVNTISGFTLLPNPNTGVFTIKGSLATPGDDNVSIIITDMLGQHVYSTTAQAHAGMVNERIALPGFIADGMYQVSVTSGADHVVFHVVINK